MTRSQWKEHEGRVFQPEGTKGGKILYVRSRNVKSGQNTECEGESTGNVAANPGRGRSAR